MTFEPSGHLISVVRRFVRAMCEQILGSGEFSSQVALVTHELLENAVRYCRDEQTSIALAVREQGGALEVEVKTENQARDEDIARARGLLDRIAEADDLFELYQSMILEAADRVRGSGLGLIRICAETELTLEMTTRAETIVMLARLRVPGGQKQ
ncbi:MAG: ATP-binding protein [Myxococcales bacterium]|nr:ATP-binding protein [Myxococcales bacterium]MCB9756504.1 ATP-binding protein [Myxococcales bacterium]